MKQLNNPKVTVVLAAYNLSHCIRASVESLLRQTLEDFELIICEDCSTDDTYDILTQLAGSDPRIRLLRNEVNSGQALGRNRCFGLARGEYIAIQDGDDYSRATRLERQAAFLDGHPEFSFVSSHADTINDNGDILDRPNNKNGEIDKKSFLWGLPFLHPTTMFRKSALLQAGGYRVDPETRFRNEDYDLFMRMYTAGMRGYVLPEHLYIYYEGLSALRRRKYRYRLAEASVRYRNFKALGLMPLGLMYVAKPMIVGLIPQSALNVLRYHLYQRKNLRE